MVLEQIHTPSMERIYSCKQLGSRQHPALRSFKPSSSTGSLRRSANNWLGESVYTTSSSSTFLPTISTGRQKRYPGFSNDVPSVLAGCRRRLADADHAMSQVVAWELSREHEMEESSKDNRKSAGSMGYGLNEPAEPSMQDSSLVEDEMYNKADAESRETKSQLGKIEQQLYGLDRRWQSIERERQDWELLRWDLLEKLRASENKYYNLNKMNEEMISKNSKLCDTEKGLRSDLQESQETIEKLRQDLGVSEERANALEAEVSNYQSRETVLHTQLSSLQSRIYEAENDVVTLRNQLESSELAKSDGSHALDNLQAAHDALTEAEAMLRIEYDAYKQEAHAEIQRHKQRYDELQADKEQDTLRHSETVATLTTQKEIELEELRKSVLSQQANEAELRKSIEDFATERKSWKPSEEDPKLVELQQQVDELKDALAKKDVEIGQPPQRDDKERALNLHLARKCQAVDVELPPIGLHFLEKDSSLVSETAFVPTCDVLLRATTDMRERTGSRPVQCQVDSKSKALRLLVLGPIGPPRIIPFDEISCVEQLGVTDIQLQWFPVGSKSEEMSLRLLPSDEDATSMLVASLTAHDRGRPGSSVGTPDTPRSEISEAG